MAGCLGYDETDGKTMSEACDQDDENNADKNMVIDDGTPSMNGSNSVATETVDSFNRRINRSSKSNQDFSNTHNQEAEAVEQLNAELNGTVNDKPPAFEQPNTEYSGVRLPAFEQPNTEYSGVRPKLPKSVDSTYAQPTVEQQASSSGSSCKEDRQMTDKKIADSIKDDKKMTEGVKDDKQPKFKWSSIMTTGPSIMPPPDVIQRKATQVLW